MPKKYGVKWLNFLYSFFGFEVLFKGIMSIGTITAIFEKGNEFEEKAFVTFENAVAICSIILIFVEIFIKLMACIYNKKKEGYSYMVKGLIWGPISSSFYVFFDQGLATGFAFMVFDVLLNVANYFYVRKRKEIFDNPYYFY